MCLLGVLKDRCIGRLWVKQLENVKGGMGLTIFFGLLFVLRHWVHVTQL